jgi:hypothetical protein
MTMALPRFSANAGQMSRPFPEQAADNLLRRYGLVVIWELHLMAARLNREGRPKAASSLIEIADAAEFEWQRRAAANRKPQ